MEENFSETSVKIKLGKKEYVVRFGIFAQRRIREQFPDFSIFDSLPDFELIPFLIQAGIEPSVRDWKDEVEFIDQYEACKDEENLKLIPLAYQNAVGFTSQRLEPLIQRVMSVVKQAGKTELSGETGGEAPE